MKAFVVDRYGPDGLRPADIPVPDPGPGDVLVRIAAAGVNPLDTMIRDGEFKQLLRYRRPFVLGHDIAGTITAVGDAVTRFSVGDQVYARPRDLRIGGFPEYITIDQAEVALKPRTLTMRQAAAVPLVSLAAWQILHDLAHITPGQRVLIHAGAGGLGTTLIQLARHFGAHVTTTARRRDADQLHQLGADQVIDYTTTDFTQEPSNYQLVIDSLGGQNLQRSLTVLAPGGLAVSVVGPPDPHFARQVGHPALAPVLWTLSRTIRRDAHRAGVRYAFFFMHADGTQLHTLAQLYDQGQLVPVLDPNHFRPDQTLDALQHLESGHADGKIVISEPTQE